jgi:CubicO group peptidase (beta-lactamase class C family)
MALRLVDQGLIDLDGDVHEVLHSWKIPKNKHTLPQPDGTPRVVTLRRLLLHTSGISPAHYMGYPMGLTLPTLRQILGRTASSRLR